MYQVQLCKHDNYSYNINKINDIKTKERETRGKIMH